MQIVLDHIGQHFRNNWVFRNLSYTFEKDAVYHIAGPNGSGKSTLIRIISGYSTASEGRIEYFEDGASIAQSDWYERLSIVSPYTELITEYTLEEMIEFHFKFKASREGISNADIPEKLKLPSGTGKPISTYSSGMMQRLKLGLALLSESDLLLLDEPAMNLDSSGIEWYHKMLQQYSSDKIVIIGSNHPDLETPAHAKQLDITAFK